jgi:hypothetical protein
MLWQPLPHEEDFLVLLRWQMGAIITEMTGVGEILVAGRTARKRSFGRPRETGRDLQSDSGVMAGGARPSVVVGLFKKITSMKILFLLEVLLLIRPIVYFEILILNVAFAICDMCWPICVTHAHSKLYTICM